MRGEHSQRNYAFSRVPLVLFLELLYDILHQRCKALVSPPFSVVRSNYLTARPSRPTRRRPEGKEVMMSKLIIFALSFMLAGCGASMSAVGVVEKNRVYVIKHGDFLSSSRMILVVDENGKVVASSGGTVQGGGAFTTQAAIGIVSAGATVYGFQALSQAIQGASATVKGIPSDVGVRAHGTVNGTVTIDGEPSTFTGTLAP